MTGDMILIAMVQDVWGEYILQLSEYISKWEPKKVEVGNMTLSLTEVDAIDFNLDECIHWPGTRGVVTYVLGYFMGEAVKGTSTTRARFPGNDNDEGHFWAIKNRKFGRGGTIQVSIENLGSGKHAR